MSTSTINPGPSAPEAGGQPSPPPLHEPHGRRWWLAVGLVAVLVLAAVGWVLWRNWVPSAPGGLSAANPTVTSVQLRWTASTEGPGVDQYLVMRDGNQAASVASSVTSYTDEALMPDTTYRFTVVAASGSKRSEPTAEVVVRTMPAQPLGLRTALTLTTTIALTWSEPKAGPAPATWVVLRDGTEVGSVPGTTTSFEDTGLTFGTTYRYGVVAVSGGNRSEPSDELAVTTLPASPTGLKATARTTTTVTLAWAYPEGPVPGGFTIRRDGESVGKVAGTVRTFQDKGLRPARTYSYTVSAETGTASSQVSAALKVATLTPPVADARLTGEWDVDGTITKSSTGITIGNAAALGQTFGGFWTFTPKCATGACDVTVDGRLAGHSFTMTLKRSGAVYTGSTTAHISHCTSPVRSIDVQNTVSVSVTVKKAGLDGTVWAADTFGGTLTVKSPYTSAGSSGSTSYYCPAGSLTAGLTGSP